MTPPNQPERKNVMTDLVVIGGGPAGMTAALYALRNGKSVLVLEKTGFGGQITHSPKVENYPGTMVMSGNEFADKFLEQILAQGAEVELETAVRIRDDGEIKYVLTEEGGEYACRAVVIATGVKHRMLGLPGEDELVGEGISFCAVCDGDFYKGKTVLVAGGGNSALQEAMLLSDGCKEVILLQDMDFFTGEAKLREAVLARENVKGITGVAIRELLTENGEFRGVVAEKKADGEKITVYGDGLFVAIGLIPENENFRDVAPLNAYGYIDAGEDCLTGRPGIYTAGDCRAKSVRQITTAVADGAVAALAACRYLDTL